MQHRTKPPVRGRHRRTAPLHSHRAPGTPFGERSRYAVLTAALVAGVGVAGVSAATAGATPSHPQAPVDDAPAQPPTTDRTSTMTTTPHVVAALPAAGVVSAVRVGALSRAQRKDRPVPVAQWVNPLPEAAVTSCFGQRWGRLHAGVDLAAADRTRIRSAGAGTIVLAGVEAGYGNAVLVDHGNGFLTHYGHMSVITVRAGQQVAAGEQLGNEGSTGHSTGPHLHFEVHQGTYQNPIEPTAWLHTHGVDIPGCPPPT